MIQKKAWPFYRTSSGVRLFGSSKNSKGLTDPASRGSATTIQLLQTAGYEGTFGPPNGPSVHHLIPMDPPTNNPIRVIENIHEVEYAVSEDQSYIREITVSWFEEMFLMPSSNK